MLYYYLYFIILYSLLFVDCILCYHFNSNRILQRNSHISFIKMNSLRESITTSHSDSSISSIIQQLQDASNGFDLRGIYIDETNSSNCNNQIPYLTNELAFYIGIGFGEYIRKQVLDNSKEIHIGVGRDPRSSGLVLSNYLCAGLEYACNRIKAYDCGLCTTPSMYISCSKELLSNLYDNTKYSYPWPFDGAISITASHLPSEWNGMKFFTCNHPTNIGEEGIQAIIKNVKKLKESNINILNKVKIRKVYPFLTIYSKYLQFTILKLLNSKSMNPLNGIKICVNAGNGAGGFLASTLSELGADVSSSINLEPDGTFPIHIPNPEDKIAMSTTLNQVIETHADIGICLDCDADRVGLIDGISKTIINRNKLVALVATAAVIQDSSLVQEINGSKFTIVTDSATSNGITRYIESKLQGNHLRFKKGYRFVIEKGKSIPSCLVAVECSGHGGWKSNNWVDDGCYTAIRLVTYFIQQHQQNVSIKSLDSLISEYEEPIESREFRIKVINNQRQTIQMIENIVIEKLKFISKNIIDWSIEPINYEGIRINFNHKSGWFMLRRSLHEPILSLHIESELPHGILALVKVLVSDSGIGSLKEQIDLQSLYEYIETVV